MNVADPNFYISHIPKEMVDIMWPHVQGYLQDAMEYSHGEASLAHVRQSIVSGQANLVAIFLNQTIVAAITYTIIDFPERRSCRINLLGGTQMHLWISHLLAFLDDVGIKNQAVMLELAGRKGWAKVLAPYGYHEMHTTFCKPIKLDL